MLFQFPQSHYFKVLWIAEVSSHQFRSADLKLIIQYTSLCRDKTLPDELWPFQTQPESHSSFISKKQPKTNLSMNAKEISCFSRSFLVHPRKNSSPHIWIAAFWVHPQTPAVLITPCREKTVHPLAAKQAVLTCKLIGADVGRSHMRVHMTTLNQMAP